MTLNTREKPVQPVDPEGRQKRLYQKIKVLEQGERALAEMKRQLQREADELSTPESQALQVLEQWANLHCAEVEFSLGDSAAEELGRERVIRDNLNLYGANSIGSYVRGSTDEQPKEVVGDNFWDDRTTEVVPFDKRNGKHRLLLDLDVPHVYVPSSTEGHGHLIVDVALEFNHMLSILNTLFEAGILQSGFAAATKKRGETWLRAPGVKKTSQTDAL